jgi:uncharacterized membrane protein
MQRNHTGPAMPEPTTAVPTQKTSAETRPIFLTYATLGVNVLASSNHDPLLRFHAFQAVFYVLAALAGHALLTVFGGVVEPLRPIYDLAAVGAYGYLLWLAWEGRPRTLPVIGPIARKQAAPSTNSGPTTLQ